MIYLTREQALFANDGRFIKHINCPLASKLARAVSLAEPERDFHCSECSSKVKNLRFLTDSQAISAVEQDPSVCFFATAKATNVVHVTFPSDQEWRAKNGYRVGLKNGQGSDWPTIRTARGIEEMNFAIENGFRVIPRKLEAQAGTKDSVALCQDTETGRFFYLHDWRQGWAYDEEPDKNAVASTRGDLVEDQRHLDGDSEKRNSRRVFNFFSYAKDEPTPPVAGYVIPKDLASGTRVFLEDVIEHLVQEFPQDSAERLPCWWGTWTGEDIKLARFEPDVILG